MSSRRKAPRVQSGKQDVGEQRRQRRKLKQEQGTEEARRTHAYEEMHTSEESNRSGRDVHMSLSTRTCPKVALRFEKYRARDDLGAVAQDEAGVAAGSRHGSTQEEERGSQTETRETQQLLKQAAASSSFRPPRRALDHSMPTPLDWRVEDLHGRQNVAREDAETICELLTELRTRQLPRVALETYAKRRAEACVSPMGA